ncbi:MAG: multidrug effflux MFS transporter [Bacteroidetes bacterium]|nr:multidrug effflux MFS transporter [Bacteroidota bacterium]
MDQTRIPIPRYFLPFFGMLAAIVPFAIDAYLPAIPSMAVAFHVEVFQMNQTISAFLIGYALGQVFGGPFSDQLGRKVIGLSGLAILLVSTFLILFVGDIFQLKVLRFIQAIGGGFTSVICMASIRDVYPPHIAGRKYAVVTMIMLLMPLLAPVIGSVLLPLGWKAIFLSMFTFILMAALIYIFGIPESRVVEKKRLDFNRIFSQFKQVIERRNDENGRVILYVLSMGFSAAVMLIFVTNSAFIYMEHFKVSPSRFPIFFGANVILMMGFIRYSMHRMKTVHPHFLFTAGNLVQFSFSTLLLIYVLLFQASLYPTFFLLVGTVGAMGLVNPNASAVYISHYDELSGSATSLNSMFILMMGGLIGGVVSVFLDNGLIPVAIGMFLCSLTSNLIGRSIPRPLSPFHKMEIDELEAKEIDRVPSREVIGKR